MFEVKHRRLLAATTAVLIAGCTGGQGQGTAVREDSSGVAIVRNTAPLWGVQEEWALASTPRLEIGAVSGQPNFEFNQIGAAVRLDDGRVVVADAAADSPLRMYTADGEYIAGIGHRGPGPEEYQRIGALQRIQGDSVVVVDEGARRVTILDGQGNFGRSTSFKPAVGPAPITVRRLEAGRWVGYVNGFERLTSVPTGLKRMTATVMILDSQGQLSDTLGTFAGPDVAFIDTRTGIVPFGHTYAFAVAGDTIYSGTGDDLAYDVYTAAGRLVRSVRFPGFDLTLSDAEWEEFRQVTLEAVPNGPARTALGSYLDNVPRLEKKAAYARILVDPQGNVWLGPFETPFSAFGPWRIFTQRGQYLGELDVPGQLRVLDIGEDYVLGQWKDDLGVESIRIYEIRK